MKQILYAREFHVYINKINIDFMYEIYSYIYIYIRYIIVMERNKQEKKAEKGRNRMLGNASIER